MLRTHVVLCLCTATAVALPVKRELDIAPPSSPFSIDILVTREVRGAVYPVNKWNTECSASAYNETPCDCFGGASRRNAILSSAGTDAIRLDIGSYASGSGLFFPALHGNASAAFLAGAGYDAIGLMYREFGAGVSNEELTGGVWLAEYISQVRTLDPTLPPAVATNVVMS